MTGEARIQKTLDLEMTQMKRNPYLMDYDAKRVIQYQKKKKRQRIRRRKSKIRRMILLFKACVCVVLLGVILSVAINILGAQKQKMAETAADVNIMDFLSGEKIQGLKAADYEKHPAWTEDFLTLNEYSRPGEALKEVSNIFVHYTANPGTSAAQNRSYFEQLKDNHERSASAHFIIGYEGEIIQCIPLDEIGYAVQTRNYDSISIECCYLAADGSFTQETYDSLITLLKWLTDVYDLGSEDILRHYDCGGKKCPLYYVEHADAWEQLRRDVRK